MRAGDEEKIVFLPAEPEETNRNTESAEESRGKSQFRFDLSVFIELWLLDPMKIKEEWRKDEESSYKDTQKRQSFFSKVKAVNFDENNGETFEPDVQKSIYEGNIHVE